MSKSNQRVILVVVVMLAVLCAVGMIYVQKKQESAAVQSFSTRFVDFALLGFESDGEGVTIEADKDALAISWTQRQSEALTIVSQPMKCSSEKSLQLDVYVGGTQNAEGKSRSLYRLWLEATLLRGDESVKAERIELPLESSKQRARQYSMRISYDGLLPDSYRLAFRVEPLDGVIAAGTLNASYLEVIER